jgi:hypothetical protein
MPRLAAGTDVVGKLADALAATCPAIRALSRCARTTLLATLAGKS